MSLSTAIIVYEEKGLRVEKNELRIEVLRKESIFATLID